MLGGGGSSRTGIECFDHKGYGRDVSKVLILSHFRTVEILTPSFPERND